VTFTCTCGSNDCWREEVDIGVGTMFGPWNCNACGRTHRDAQDAAIAEMVDDAEFMEGADIDRELED